MFISKTSFEMILPPKTEIDRRGWQTVIGGVLIHLMVGNLYLWGNVSPYVISYFHYKGDMLVNDSLTISVIPISFAV